MLCWAQDSPHTQNRGACLQEGSSCAGGQSCPGGSGNAMHNVKGYVVGTEPGTQTKAPPPGRARKGPGSPGPLMVGTTWPHPECLLSCHPSFRSLLVACSHVRGVL